MQVQFKTPLAHATPTAQLPNDVQDQGWCAARPWKWTQGYNYKYSNIKHAGDARRIGKTEDEHMQDVFT